MFDRNDPYMQYEAEIVKRVQESDTIFSIYLKFTDPEIQKKFSSKPGQCNMLYHYGAGEVAISIMSDPEAKDCVVHTIEAVGRMTNAISKLKVGDSIGLRGPFGTSWPVDKAINKDVIIITGGLGCAPTISAIDHIVSNRNQYGHLAIIQGVRSPEKHVLEKRFNGWKAIPNTKVIVAASGETTTEWAWQKGRVTNFIKDIDIKPQNTICMMCGPEGMMKSSCEEFIARGIPEHNIYVSMERNMHCGIGQCGHCQTGGLFVCKDGPVFSYDKIKGYFGKVGV